MDGGQHTEGPKRPDYREGEKMMNLIKLPFKVLNYYLTKVMYQSFPNMSGRLKSVIHFVFVWILILVIAWPMMPTGTDDITMMDMFWMFIGSGLRLIGPFLAAYITADAWRRFYKNDEHAKEHFIETEEYDFTNGASPIPTNKDKRKRRAIIK
jgi:hypothetical protein